MKTPHRTILVLLLLAVSFWLAPCVLLTEDAQPGDNLVTSDSFAEGWKSAWRIQDGGEDFPQGEVILDEKVFHSPPVRVFAEGSPRGNFSLILRFRDGSLTTIQHSLAGHFDYPKELIEATTNHVTIAMDQHIEVRQCGLPDEPVQSIFPYAPECRWATRTGFNGYFLELGAERKRAAQAGERPRWLNVVKGHAAHLDRFLDHLEGKGDNPCEVESAVAVNRITLKLLESVRLGLPLAVTPQDWHIPAR